jgi:hypothetical protein
MGAQYVEKNTALPRQVVVNVPGRRVVRRVFRSLCGRYEFGETKYQDQPVCLWRRSDRTTPEEFQWRVVGEF